MRDTPILDFVFACIFAVVYGTLGSLIDYWIYWVACGAAVATCVFTLPPAVGAVRKIHRKRNRKKYLCKKIILKHAKGEIVTCTACGRECKANEATVVICKMYVGKNEKNTLCDDCFNKAFEIYHQK